MAPSVETRPKDNSNRQKTAATGDIIALPADATERFFRSFERTARRWEIVVYSGLVILMILMGYGFFLIYNLTSDMRSMVSRFDDPGITANLDRLSADMASLSRNIELMTAHVAAMSKDTAKMATRMEAVGYMKSVDAELKRMNRSVFLMGGNMNRMRYDMSMMNRSVSRPLNFMNSFLPF